MVQGSAQSGIRFEEHFDRGLRRIDFFKIPQFLIFPSEFLFEQDDVTVV